MEKKYDPQLVTIKSEQTLNGEAIKKLRFTVDELGKSIEEKTQNGLRKFMADREKINEAFAKDPHHSSIATNRIQTSKLQLNLQSKVDRNELENMNMKKCSRWDLTVVSGQVSSL